MDKKYLEVCNSNGHVSIMQECIISGVLYGGSQGEKVIPSQYLANGCIARLYDEPDELMYMKLNKTGEYLYLWPHHLQDHFDRLPGFDEIEKDAPFKCPMKGEYKVGFLYKG